MTFEPTGIGDEDDETTEQDAPRPGPGFGRRFWRSLTGQRTGAERCRPVTVLGDDGQPVHAQVLGDDLMSDETRAAFAEIVRAAQRKHRAELAAERQADDDDVRAVATLLRVWETEGVGAGRYDPLTSVAEHLKARFADRIGALEAKTRAPRTPIQGSGYTPLQLLGVSENDEELTR